LTLLLESTVVVAKEQTSCDLGGEAAILDMKHGIYYGLDAVGARIWSLIQVETTVAQICDALTAEYEVEPDRCRADVMALLEDLVSHHLIEVLDGQAA